MYVFCCKQGNITAYLHALIEKEMKKNIMTKEEALQIPELQIKPDTLVEDCFYYKMALAGKIPEQFRQKALSWLKGKEHDTCYKGALIVADMMISNIEKYGVACAEWCKE